MGDVYGLLRQDKVKIADVNGMRGLVATRDILENESIALHPRFFFYHLRILYIQ